MGFKRSVADGLERLLGVSIAPQHRLGQFYERDQIRLVLDHFSIDCVFDVGANEGQYYRFLRDVVGFKGTVISYEPTPELVTLLLSQSAQDEHWHVNALALDRVEGKAAFHVARDTQFSSLKEPSKAGRSVFNDGRMEGGTVVVETATLASEFERWRHRLGFAAPYLKLDTQGHDLAVAEGAGDTLREFVAIQSEAAVVPLYSGAPALGAALDFFRARGFDPCAFVPNNEGHFPRMLETDVVFVNRSVAGLADLAAE